ncbi:transcriptional regulator, DeoR family [Lactobacillus iners LactinV 09V1-c]|nr:transcriptional regulator, DeoR family [Lactobacillus iners LactinV 09V1-c]
MLTQERHQIIVSHLKSRGICSVKELCSVTNSSQATIRRDLYELQQKGKLIRVRGGARSLNEFSSDVEQTIRFNLHVEEKSRLPKQLQCM